MLRAGDVIEVPVPQRARRRGAPRRIRFVVLADPVQSVCPQCGANEHWTVEHTIEHDGRPVSMGTMDGCAVCSADILR